MRLIDADALKETIAKYEFETPDPRRKWGGDVVLNIYMPKIIDNAPTVEAEPVRHGRWSKFGDCSECGGWCNGKYTQYCPNCGAKMDGGNENES